MAEIRLSGVRKTYQKLEVIHGVDATIADGEFVVIVGPSGCGKSTLLRMIAGLETISGGEIAIGGRRVNEVEPKDRNIAMVFQNYALYPHMTVYENMSYGLRIRRMPREEITQRVERAAKILELAAFLQRKPRELSGGQRQRVAMGRAIVREPAAFLFDEPLSNLDAKLREEMRLELREMVERLKVTTLFVTHEQIEALTMSDTVAVMKDGVIVQAGSPAAIYGKPAESFVADFIGKTNLLRGQVASLGVSGEGPVADVTTSIGLLRCRVDAATRAGDALALTVRPEHIALSIDGAAGHTDGGNTVVGRVETVIYLGNLLECVVAVGPETLRVQLHPSAAVTRGADVQLALPIEHCLAMRH